MTERGSHFGGELFETVFDRLPLGIVIVDAQGSIIAANAELVRLLGHERTSLLGQSIELLIPEQYAERHRHERRAYVQRPAPRPMGHGRELFARHRDGHTIPVEIGLSSITIQGRPATLCTLVDVTERHMLESQLAQTQKVEAIGNLATGIAHDFNNMLLGILGHAELAKEAAVPCPDACASLNVVIETAMRGRELVHRILKFTRRSNEPRHPTPWEPVVRDTLRLLRVSIPASVRVLVDATPNVPPVFATPIELQQIFMNLITNAVHAMPKSGGAIRVGLTTAAVSRELADAHPELRLDTYVRLSVIDEGIGIAPEFLGRIFEPFVTTKAAGEGTGLGLFVLQRVVRSLDGAVVVSSRAGHGTQFDIYLPVSRDNASVDESGESRRNRQRTHGNSEPPDAQVH